MAFNPDHNTKISLLISNGVVLAVGTIMVTLFLNVSGDAKLALTVAGQHGEEMLAVRQEMALLRGALRDSTDDRYKGRDAERDMQYIAKRLEQIEKRISTFHP